MGYEMHFIYGLRFDTMIHLQYTLYCTISITVISNAVSNGMCECSEMWVGVFVDESDFLADKNVAAVLRVPLQMGVCYVLHVCVWCVRE